MDIADRELKPLARLVLGIDRAVGLVALAGAALAAAAILACLFIVTYAVAMRYLFANPPPWADEMVGYLLVASVMGSIAYALRQGEHIAVDVLTEKLGPKGRSITEIAGLIAVAVLSALLLLEAWETVAFSQMIGLRSNGQLSAELYIPQLMMPVGFGLMLLCALSALMRRAVGLPATDASGAHLDEKEALLKKTGIE